MRCNYIKKLIVGEDGYVDIEFYKDGQVISEEEYIAAEIKVEDFLYEEEFDFDEECNCEECRRYREELEIEEDIDDSTEEENRLIEECIDVVFNSDSCTDCKINKIIELAYKFKNAGWTNHQDYIREINED